MLAAASALLAQTSAPAGVSHELEEAVRYIIVIMVLGAIPVALTCFEKLLAIIGWFKAKPPIHKEYATILKVTEIETALKDFSAKSATIAKVAEIESDLKGFITETNRHREGLNTELKSIARQMGEIAGRLNCRVPRRVPSDSQPG
jgi:hypothetical protein